MPRSGFFFRPPAAMDNDLLQRTSSSLAKSYSGSYCGARARSLDSGSSTFLVPVDGDEGRDTSDGALARYYDLARHLSEDFEAGSSAGKAETKPAAATPSATPAAQAQAQTIASSRVLQSAATALPSPESAGEIVSARASDAAATAASSRAIAKTTSAHPIIVHKLTTNSPLSGTAPASLSGDMMRPDNNSRLVPLTGGASGLVGKIRFTGFSGAQDGSSRQDDPRREERTSTSGAQAVVQTEGAPISGAGERVPAESMQNVSKALLDEMEKMRQDGATSATLSLDMPDGSKLDLKLRWKGSHVKASFSGGGTCRSDIENGWANLTLRAGNYGMTLEPPSFGDEGDGSVETSLYA